MLKFKKGIKCVYMDNDDISIKYVTHRLMKSFTIQNWSNAWKLKEKKEEDVDERKQTDLYFLDLSLPILGHLVLLHWTNEASSKSFLCMWLLSPLLHIGNDHRREKLTIFFAFVFAFAKNTHLNFCRKKNRSKQSSLLRIKLYNFMENHLETISNEIHKIWKQKWKSSDGLYIYYTHTSQYSQRIDFSLSKLFEM